jgi:hypothetical protein
MLENARKKAPQAESKATRFVPGLPKEAHWIRILPSEDLLADDVKKLAEGLGLSVKTQKDNYILVYGSKEKVKDFVKKMAEKCRGTRKS